MLDVDIMRLTHSAEKPPEAFCYATQTTLTITMHLFTLSYSLRVCVCWELFNVMHIIQDRVDCAA